MDNKWNLQIPSTLHRAQNISPFRSYLLSQSSNPNNTCCALFFGCRGKDKDFYFSTEWSELSNELPNFAFFVAFSRDSEDKVYVQHLIKENSSLMKEMIVDKGGSFFIAGNAKNMPDQSLEEHGVGDVEEYVKDMELKNRYQTET
ncbi:NADPH-dependent diflavin oxidoreductase 1, partial [Caligus rogercresseyi]